MPITDDLICEREPIVEVDATPNEEYPIRILKAYLSRTHTYWKVVGFPEAKTLVYDAMNKHQEERRRILEAAIAMLRTKRGDEGG